MVNLQFSLCFQDLIDKNKSFVLIHPIKGTKDSYQGTKDSYQGTSNSWKDFDHQLPQFDPSTNKSKG